MVTDKQVQKMFRLLAGGKTLAVAAVRTDMDEKTARKYRQLGKLPSEAARPHGWRTRSDPFAEVWTEVCALLDDQPGLQAKTIFCELQRRYPGKFADGQLRTLQRQVRRWRALHGPAKEVFFAQVHEPGRLAASDFTRMGSLGVTIHGQPFDHMVYHFVLTYSNWETATICFSESFESLSEGLQKALWELGGVPQRHRTDRLSTAVNNLTEKKEFTRRYEGLMKHYGLIPEKIQADHAHENGDIEQRHRRFKEAMDQVLMLRGSRDFVSRPEYEQFLRQVLRQLNAGRQQRLDEELALLRSLPARRLESFQRLRCRVDSGSLIHIERNNYSVPSRLIGEVVEVWLYAEHLEVWYAQQLLERLPRLRGRDKHRINYRHLIEWLVRKPGAFAQYRYRQELFPSSVFRLAYDTLVSQDAATADKEYLRLLHLAAKESEAAVEATLRQWLAEGRPIAAAAVKSVVSKDAAPTVPEVTIEAVDLRVFDDLLTEEADDAYGSEGEAGTVAAGTAAVERAEQLRGTGPAGGAGDAQLRAVPAGAVRTGMPGAANAADRAPAAAIAVATGEESGGIRPETAAGEAGPAGAEPARRQFRGPQGEPVGLRKSGCRENALACRVGPGLGASGSARVLHNIEPPGARTVGSQARPEAEDGAETAGEVRGAFDRRPGLCAAEPRGDGGVVHAFGRPLRAWQRLADEQLAVLEVGEDLQGPDDDGSSHRPASAPQRDLGIEPAQLSFGAGQEDQREISVSIRRSNTESTVGPGSAPRACAALRLAPLRQAPPLRKGPAPRPLSFRSPWKNQTGILIVAAVEE
jgi:hypothetical protein